MSVNPAIEGNQLLSSGYCDPAAMIRPRSTVPIRARGHVVPHQQAVHMTATGRTCTRGKTLANRGPSTHDSGNPSARLNPHGTASAGNPPTLNGMVMLGAPASPPPRPAVNGSAANQDSVHRTARRRRSSSWLMLV
jgi:hypothetical protein